MNILHHLPAGQFKHKGNDEWAGPCPRCGGNDRFVVWENHPSGARGGKYLCRHCAPEGGDGIQFLREFQGMTYPEACAALNVDPGNQRAHQSRPPARKWLPEPERAPSERWRQQAEKFISACAANLDTGPGREALEGRSLSLAFARAHRIGWNPLDRYEDPEAWGLEPSLNTNGKPSRLYLPAGLVIPTFRKAGPAVVKIRRRDWKVGDEWPKYHAVKGGGNGALVLGKPGLPAVVVESELDALLIAQEAAGLCAVVALGSASNRPHIATAKFLRQAPAILVALDFDQPDARGERAGAKAWAWWRANFAAAKRWPPAAGKDPGEMHCAGVPVRVWVEAGLAGKPREDAPCAPELEKTTPIPRKGGKVDWAALCPDYFQGCFTCPEYIPSLLHFCWRFDPAGEALT